MEEWKSTPVALSWLKEEISASLNVIGALVLTRLKSNSLGGKLNPTLTKSRAFSSTAVAVSSRGIQGL